MKRAREMKREYEDGKENGRKDRRWKEEEETTRYAKDERTGKWTNRSQVDGLVSTSRDGGTIENRMFLLGLERT